MTLSRLAGRIVPLVILTVLYFLAGKLGLSRAFINPSATAIWVPTGLALAAFLLWGDRVWPSILLGAFLVNVTTTGSVLPSIGIAIGNTAEGLLGAYFVTKFANGRLAFHRAIDIFKFAVLAGLVSTVVSATCGVTSLAVAGYVAWTDYSGTWFTWWLGDAGGALIVAPVLVLWGLNRQIEWDVRERGELCGALIALLLVAHVVFGGILPVAVPSYPFAFLFVPILVWVALRFGPRETATAMFLLAGLAIWQTLHGHGPFVRVSPNESLLLLQGFLGVVALMVLTLAASLFQYKRADETLRIERETLDVRVRLRTAELAEANRALRAQIHERLRAEEALRESQDRFSAAFRDAAIGMGLVSIEGRWLQVNRSLCDIVGYTEEDLLQTTFQAITHPDDLDADLAYVQQMLSGEIRTYQMEKRYLHKHGHTIWILLSVSLVRHPDEAPMYFISQIQDITQRKHLEERLRQSQKMEAIGRLAGGIAHDFNNMLTVINGFSDLLLSRPDGHAFSRTALESIKLAGSRAAGITQQLLAFSRQEPLAPTVINLHAVLLNIEKLLRPLIGEDINLIINVPDEVGHIKIDLTQMHQVIMNLAVNARDAMSQAGQLIVESRNIELGESTARTCRSLPHGPYVMLTISDTGCGIAPDIEPHIFEPFFTTKAQGKGTGLGLSMVYGIMKQNHGEICVSSQLDIGTTFTLYFPISGETTELPAKNHVVVPTARGTETVLILEDEPDVRKLVSETLQEQGYTVLEARHGFEALLLSSQRIEPIHLLITDVVMPQMSGREVAERLLTERPSLHVLFMSGHTDRVSLPEALRGMKINFLQKPFSPVALASRVREVLSGAEVPVKL